MSELNDFMRNVVAENETDRPIFVVNLDDVVQKVNKWRDHLPRIRPFYAYKCCETPGVLKTLAALGTGFDCASQHEIKTVLSLGCSPSDIVFANPCKTNDMINFAKANKVDLMTFDSELELLKVHKVFPQARLLIRIRVDDASSKYKFGQKFGVMAGGVKPLIEKAKDLKMDIVGVAFHIGSDCKNPGSFGDAIKMAKDVFLVASDLGVTMTILDIGGGFPGDIDFNDSNNLFYQMSSVINKSLEEQFDHCHFPNLQIIAEPGRYFVSSALSLLVKVIGKRSYKTDDGQNGLMYYLNDGLFGTFLIKFWEPELVKTLTPFLTPEEEQKRKKFKSTLWGPTCDSSDVVMQDVQMVELFTGDHLVIHKYGAYTVPLTTPFNGIQPPLYRYFKSKE